ncbi:MAG TPA: hypothetical protein VJL87_07035 [Bdellovibrionota bacterium]|nr:hypothetical protein [Bdellovibrionota bacterium]
MKKAFLVLISLSLLMACGSDKKHSGAPLNPKQTDVMLSGNLITHDDGSKQVTVGTWDFNKETRKLSFAFDAPSLMTTTCQISEESPFDLIAFRPDKEILYLLNDMSDAGSFVVILPPEVQADTKDNVSDNLYILNGSHCIVELW